MYTIRKLHGEGERGQNLPNGTLRIDFQSYRLK